MGGSTGALIGLIIGILIPVVDSTGKAFPLFTRLTGGAIMEGPPAMMSALYIAIAVLICGAFGALIGSLVE